MNWVLKAAPISFVQGGGVLFCIFLVFLASVGSWLLLAF